MKRGIALLFTLFLPAMGQFLVSRIDAGGEEKVLPVVEFLLIEPWKKTLENSQFCLDYRVKEKKDPGSITAEERDRFARDCQTHEWKALVVPEKLTQLAGRDLRIFWRRVEERTWWRVETQVNMGLPMAWRNDYFEVCTLKMFDFAGGGITAEEPPVKTHVLEEHVGKKFWEFKPKSFENVYPNPALSFTDGDLPPPGLLPFPRVKSGEFCEGDWKPFFWIPGVRIVVHAGPIPIDIRIPGDWPRPIYFPYDEVYKRYLGAIAYANVRYQADYWADVLFNIGGYTPKGQREPQAFPLSVRLINALWFGDLQNGGLVVQPAANLEFTNLENIKERVWQFVDLASKMVQEGYKARRVCLPWEEKDCEEDEGRKWTKPFDYKDPIAYVYYGRYLVQNLVRRLPIIGNIVEDLARKIANLTILPYVSPALDHKLAGQGPGIWRLEEAKRWLPNSVDPLLGEAQGVATLFQAWTEWDTVVLPTPVSFHGYANKTDVYLRLIPVPPFVQAEPHPSIEFWEHPLLAPLVTITGPRVHFGWVNVPEGYSVPRVKEAPRLSLPWP